MSSRIPDYLRKAHKVSTKHGWKWDKRGSQHMMVFDPEGRAVTNFTLTGYDGNLRKKLISQLRKAGCPGL